VDVRTPFSASLSMPTSTWCGFRKNTCNPSISPAKCWPSCCHCEGGVDMDVHCSTCGEPWDTFHLQPETAAVVAIFRKRAEFVGAICALPCFVYWYVAIFVGNIRSHERHSGRARTKVTVLDAFSPAREDYIR
jgi:hypothetical protein